MIRAFLPLGLLLVTLTLAHADLMKELSTADQQKVQGGGQVVVAEELAGYPWPRVRLYQTVKATPREVMAVFTDYNNASKFVPNCLKSKISKEINPLSFEVSYLIDVPILTDEAYTVRNTLNKEPSGALCVQWKLLKATSILESQGSLFVEPRGEGSMLRYTNLVKPSSRAAMLLRGMALSQMKDTVTAIVNEVEKEKAAPASLKPGVERVDAALGGK